MYLPGDDDVILSIDVKFPNGDISVYENLNVSTNVLGGDDFVTDAEYSTEMQFDN